MKTLFFLTSKGFFKWLEFWLWVDPDVIHLILAENLSLGDLCLLQVLYLLETTRTFFVQIKWEKKALDRFFQVMLCVFLQCGIWEYIWKLPDTKSFSIVYTLCIPLSNSFKLRIEQKANQDPVSSGFVLNVFLKAEIKWVIVKWSYVCSTAIGENWRAASWVLEFFWLKNLVKMHRCHCYV